MVKYHISLHYITNPCILLVAVHIDVQGNREIGENCLARENCNQTIDGAQGGGGDSGILLTGMYK